jgi:hypothetical protein
LDKLQQIKNILKQDQKKKKITQNIMKKDQKNKKPLLKKEMSPGDIGPKPLAFPK